MNIRIAENKDTDLLLSYDRHISKEELIYVIGRKRVYIAEDQGQFAGWLRYGLFWDSIPFMNLLYVREEYRGKGFGRQLVMHWENEMRQQGHTTWMTSTQADEYAQHFYFQLGYEAIGGFRPGSDPYEILFSKNGNDREK